MPKIIKYNLLLLCMVFTISFCLVLLVGNKLNDKMFTYAEIETNRIAKKVILSATNSFFIEGLNIDDLYTTQKSDNNDILIVDFNPIKVNELLKKISTNIMNDFNEIESGNNKLFHREYNLITNTPINIAKKGIVLEIPIGVLTNNSILSNIGPKIPIKISFSGEVQLGIETQVQNYGLNNAIINMYINIEVVERVILPLTTEKIVVKNKIPVTIKIIQGNIPQYYINGINNSSNVFRTT